MRKQTSISICIALILLTLMVGPVMAMAPGEAVPPDTSRSAAMPAVPADPLVIMGLLAVMVAIAWLIETLVESIFSPIFDKVPALAPYKSFLMYIAMVAGLAGAFIYQFDLPAILGSFLKADIPVTWFGITLTGLAIGKGSNYLHDFIQKYFVKPAAKP